MIGDLLKQLFVSLGHFIRFHTARLLHLEPRSTPVIVEAPESQAIAKSRALDPNLLDNNAMLSSVYTKPVEWATYRDNAVPGFLASDPLYQLWMTRKGGQKWSHYFQIYGEVFGPLAGRAVRVLEIGVYKGASLELWRKYFAHPDSLIVGIDIDPGCAQFDAPNDGKRVRIGSQSDPIFLKGVLEEFGPFDLIIDDGSHLSSHMIASFNALFATGLTESGIYFVEDLHANYWPGWRNSQNSFLDVCKEMVEHMHAHYRSASPNELFINVPSDHPIDSISVPRITTMIKEIRFFDSIVAIYKTRSEFAPYFLRNE